MRASSGSVSVSGELARLNPLAFLGCACGLKEYLSKLCLYHLCAALREGRVRSVKDWADPQPEWSELREWVAGEAEAGRPIRAEASWPPTINRVDEDLITHSFWRPFSFN